MREHGNRKGAWTRRRARAELRPQPERSGLRLPRLCEKGGGASAAERPGSGFRGLRPSARPCAQGSAELSGAEGSRVPNTLLRGSLAEGQ